MIPNRRAAAAAAAAVARATREGHPKKQLKELVGSETTMVLSYASPSSESHHHALAGSPGCRLPPGRHIRQNSWVEPSLIRLDSDGTRAAINPPLSPNKDALSRGAPPPYRLPDLGTKATQAHRGEDPAGQVSSPAGQGGLPDAVGEGEEPRGPCRRPPRKQSSLALAQEWTEKFKYKVTD